MRSSFLTCGIVALAVSALSPAAMGIVVNESSFPGGDFNSSVVIGGQPTVITTPLTLGANSISGRSTNTGTTPDNDYFRVTLPAGATIDLVELVISNYVPPTGPGFGALALFTPNSGSATFGSNATISVDFTINDPSNVRFTLAGPSALFGAPSAGSYAYVLSLNVVPAPGAAAMLGVAGLGAMRRRRR